MTHITVKGVVYLIYNSDKLIKKAQLKRKLGKDYEKMYKKKLESLMGKGKMVSLRSNQGNIK
jgi:hypothetical protein